MWFGHRPRRPTPVPGGDGPATAFFQAVWDFIHHFDIKGRGGITVDRTPNGYVLDVKPGIKGGEGTNLPVWL